MKQSYLVLGTSGEELFSQGSVMRDLYHRVIGLMGRRSIDSDAAYLFPRCTSVHTCFMRTAIDLIFLDANLKILKIDTLRPWHVSRPVADTWAIMEAAPGIARMKGLREGAMLTVRKRVATPGSATQRPSKKRGSGTY